MANKKEKKKRLLSPITTLLLLILIVLIGSSWLAILNFDGTKTTIENGILENSIVVVQNIFSKEGITYFFSNIITNFCSMEPFILLILSYFAVSIAKSSGIIKHIAIPLKKIKPPILTFIIVFISIIAFIFHYSYRLYYIINLLIIFFTVCIVHTHYLKYSIFMQH